MKSVAKRRKGRNGEGVSAGRSHEAAHEAPITSIAEDLRRIMIRIIAMMKKI
jgi:hypothetical protein